jgi:hypothetical protein
MLRRTAIVSGFVLLASVSPRPLAAQIHVDLGPVVGFYAGSTSFPSIEAFFAPAWKQAISVSYGAEAILWHRHLGLAASYLVAPSDIKVNGSPAPNLEASIRVAALEAMLDVEVGELANTVQFSGGVARVLRRGDAYKAYDDPASTALVLGLGTRFELLDRLGLDLGLKGLVYSLRLSSGNIETESTTQADFLGHLGLVLRLH